MINELAELERYLAKSIADQEMLGQALEEERTARRQEMESLLISLYELSLTQKSLTKPLADYLIQNGVQIFTPDSFSNETCEAVGHIQDITKPYNEIVEVRRKGLIFCEKLILKAQVVVVKN